MNCGTTNCGCGSTEGTVAKRVQAPAEQTTTFRPEVDIYETGDSYIVTADVPGARPETIDLNVENGVLTLRAGVAERTTDASRTILREYAVGGYERSFRIGEGIDAERIDAELKNGVLTLRLPKAETTRSRKIAVKTAG
jgi:HSP20 family molecular chaperone IbpA